MTGRARPASPSTLARLSPPLELGPVGYLREASDDFLVVPAVVVNVGLVQRLELVAEGKGESGVQIRTQGPDEGAGASVVGVASQSWESLTLHLNLGGELTPEHDTILFAGLIVEGPGAWRVRPVAELRVEQALDHDETLASGLVGAIWRVSDRLSLDSAVRAGQVDASGLFEIRAGLTWSFGL